jgi:hypothetical protein
MVKHNLLALPLAITLWLFLYKRRSFYIWLATLLAMLVGCLGLFYLIYGSNFFTSLLAAPRDWGLGTMAEHLDRWFTPLLLLLASGSILLAIDYSNLYTQLMTFYVLFAGIWGIFISGGAGVNFNAIFDLIIGLTLMSGLAIQRLGEMFSKLNISDRKALTPSLVQITGMFILCLTVLFTMPQRGVDLLLFIGNLENEKALVTKDIAFIAAHDGPAMCENLALCYWAGKSFEVDVFNTGQKLKTDALDEKELTKLLETHYFAIIQVDERYGSPSLPGSVNKQILANYEIRRSSRTSGVFLLPIAKQRAAV